MRFLAASDIHLGRIPSLPDAPAAVTSRSAWEAVVQCALDRRVDVLLLAGDVVEQDNAWFEAYGPFLRGLERLGAAGVRVVAVAGNHDAQLFPRLAEDAPGLTLLGRKGTWEALPLDGITLVGWSFPSRVHLGNPLATFPEGELTGGRPYLGLLHCDLDAPAGSRYAPVPSSGLEATGAGLWVLGHIHKGEPRAAGRAVYCGSPFALDAGEEGEHGAWYLETDAEGRLAPPERVLLSPWEFRTVEVDLEGAPGLEAVEDRVAAAFRGAARAAEGRAARTVYASLRLSGPCGLAGNLEGLLKDRLPAFRLDLGGVSLRPTSRVADATAPLLDLPALARDRGVKAALARLLLQAQDPGGPADALPDATPDVLPGVLDDVRRLGSFTEAEAREILSLAARRLLTALQAQGGEA